jgi:hypothetical protein
VESGWHCVLAGDKISRRVEEEKRDWPASSIEWAWDASPVWPARRASVHGDCMVQTTKRWEGRSCRRCSSEKLLMVWYCSYLTAHFSPSLSLKPKDQTRSQFHHDTLLYVYNTFS